MSPIAVALERAVTGLCGRAARASWPSTGPPARARGRSRAGGCRCAARLRTSATSLPRQPTVVVARLEEQGLRALLRVCDPDASHCVADPRRCRVARSCPRFRRRRTDRRTRGRSSCFPPGSRRVRSGDGGRRGVGSCGAVCASRKRSGHPTWSSGKTAHDSQSSDARTKCDIRPPSPRLPGEQDRARWRGRRAEPSCADVRLAVMRSVTHSTPSAAQSVTNRVSVRVSVHAGRSEVEGLERAEGRERLLLRSGDAIRRPVDRRPDHDVVRPSLVVRHPAVDQRRLAERRASWHPTGAA